MPMNTYRHTFFSFLKSDLTLSKIIHFSSFTESLYKKNHSLVCLFHKKVENMVAISSCE